MATDWFNIAKEIAETHQTLAATYSAIGYVQAIRDVRLHLQQNGTIEFEDLLALEQRRDAQAGG